MVQMQLDGFFIRQPARKGRAMVRHGGWPDKFLQKIWNLNHQITARER